MLACLSLLSRGQPFRPVFSALSWIQEEFDFSCCSGFYLLSGKSVNMKGSFTCGTGDWKSGNKFFKHKIFSGNDISKMVNSESQHSSFPIE